MDCRHILVIFILILTNEGLGYSIQRREDGFDPNKLMDRYMDMRTDQDIFGSFHPNDLIKTITEYFKHGGGQQTENLWGMFVNNPNENIAQYTSRLESPGTLGPRMNAMSHSSKGHQLNQEAVGFDPSALNQNLMQSIKNDDSMSNWNNMNQLNTQINTGFDPDTINRKLMGGLLDNLKQGATNNVNGQASNKTPSGKAEPASSNNSASNTAMNGVGFNPNLINAQLLSSVKFNQSPAPNTLSSPGTTSRPTNKDNGASNIHTNTQNTEPHNNGHKDTGDVNSNTHAQNTKSFSFGSGFQSSTGSGYGFMSNSNAANTIGNQYITNAGNMLQTNTNNQLLVNGANPFNVETKERGSNGLVGKDNNAINTGAAKTPNETGSQVGHGLPPGIPTELKLEQTEPKSPNVHGIGGLG